VCAATILLLGATAAAYLAGAIPVALAIPLNTLAIYLSFTVMHEAMHGVAHSNRTVNTWLGRLMGPLLTITYPMFRAVHYEHHSHTNDPDRDPDLYLAHVPVWLLPLGALLITFEYRSRLTHHRWQSFG
jgi:beta-carotene hydroxylase